MDIFWSVLGAIGGLLLVVAGGIGMWVGNNAHEGPEEDYEDA